MSPQLMFLFDLALKMALTASIVVVISVAVIAVGLFSRHVADGLLLPAEHGPDRSGRQP